MQSSRSRKRGEFKQRRRVLVLRVWVFGLSFHLRKNHFPSPFYTHLASRFYFHRRVRERFQTVPLNACRAFFPLKEPLNLYLHHRCLIFLPFSVLCVISCFQILPLNCTNRLLFVA